MRSLSTVLTLLAALTLTLASMTPGEIGPGAGGDANSGSGRDGGSNSHDGGGQLVDGGGFPDVVVQGGGYVISDGTGAEGTEGTGGMPAGDLSSPVYIDPFVGNRTFIPGGTNMFSGQVQGGLVQAMLVGFEELGGYFEIPSQATSFDLYVTLGQDVRRSSLTLVIVPVLTVSESQPAGGYGQPLRVPCTVQQVGTGDLQVSLSWTSETDVDLHLVEPSGEDIFWSNTISGNGGELDLDSNAGCSMDNVNNENITYQNGNPPAGHYVVRVDYWSACSHSATTDYVVTVTLRGTPTLYQGSFSQGDADQGGDGSGVTVAEFDF